MHCQPRMLREMDGAENGTGTLQQGILARRGAHITSQPDGNTLGCSLWMAGREKRCCWPGGRVSQPTVVGVWCVGLVRQKKTKKGKQHQCTQVHSRMGNTGKCSKEKPECLCGSDGAGVAGSGTGWEGIRAGAEVACGRQQQVLVGSVKGVAVLGLCRDLTHLWRGCRTGGRELPWLGRRGKGLTWAGVGCSLGLGVNPLSLSGATGWSSSSSWPCEDAALPHGNTSNPFHGKNNSSIPLWQALLVHFSPSEWGGGGHWEAAAHLLA